jgi:uncharacterized protein YprB with RNaseH-like and TPR domain
MSSTTLSDRLRGIIQGTRPSPIPVLAPDVGVHALPELRRDPSSESTDALYARAAAILGGFVTTRDHGAVIVVEREYPADAVHGRSRVGDLATAILEGQDAISMLKQAWPSTRDHRTSGPLPATSRWLFLDLETTGLTGGAGTQAFLVGCASIEGRSIWVRQFLLPDFEHERALLGEFTACSDCLGGLVTFNGRSFDVPLIETRYLYHRAAFPIEDVLHLDMLYPARRLWKARATPAGPDPDDGSCSLAVLEKQVAGLHRVGDVPGYQIPSRYFRFIREGDARPLEAVLEHNRLDLISLIAVMARVIRLIEQGPSSTSTPQECLGLARIYERAGAAENAEASLLRAVEMAARFGTEPEAHAEALRRLAWYRRRAGRFREAADAWNALADLPRCPSMLRHEAREALAIYHEHRSRDLGTARSLVLEVLSEDVTTRKRTDAEYRLRRLERKLSIRKERRDLFAALDELL